MQLLAAMQLLGPGRSRTHATAWLQAAAWLRMGPKGPRGLGPWALWAPGVLGPNFEKIINLLKVAPKGLF